MPAQGMSTGPVPVAPPAIGGVGGGTGPAIGDPNLSLKRWKATGADPWDRAKAAHLMRRAGFAARPEEIDAMVTLGMDRCVDLLLSTPNQPIAEHGVAVTHTGEVLDLSIKEHQQGLWLYQMVVSPWQLQEKVALFWHDHFATGIQKVQVGDLMGRQINLFRRHGLGHFRDLLVGISRDPAMLFWLDNWLNTATLPQENYGREILELFSVGVDAGYTENDVRAMARCFTGWTTTAMQGNQFWYNDAVHDYTAKTVLGHAIQNPRPNGEQDAYDAIDVILAQPQTSRYVVRKIVEWFCQQSPDAALVQELADHWVDSGYSTRAVFDVLLRSRWFYSSYARRTLVKSPIEHMVGAMRQLGIDNVRYGGITRNALRGNPNGLGYRVFLMGFDLLNYDNPSGLEEGTAWVNSLYLVERGNAIMELTRTTGSQFAAVMDPRREINRVGLLRPDAIVDHYLRILLDDAIDPIVRQNLRQYMVTGNNGAPFRFDVTQQASVDTKVRGLVHLIMLLPEYWMN